MGPVRVKQMPIIFITFEFDEGQWYIDLIKSIPGVRTATVANQVPLSGSGSGTGLRTEPDETIESVPTARFRWSEDGLDALGVELTRGRNFYPEEVNYILPASDPPAPASICDRLALDEAFTAVSGSPASYTRPSSTPCASP